jgi:hypothetical protein
MEPTMSGSQPQAERDPSLSNIPEQGEVTLRGPKKKVSRAAAGDKTLKNAQIFEGAASRQISDNESRPVDGILVEMQGDDGKHYIIRGTITVKMSPNESIAGRCSPKIVP